MAYLIGLVIALVVSLSATFIGLDRDRAFYPTVLAGIASYYGLFAVIGSSVQAVLIESLVMAVFLAAAVLGFKRNLWLVVGALLVHGIFDFFHGHIISNPGVPVWWPAFCLTFDVAAAGYLAWLLRQSRLAAMRSNPSIERTSNGGARLRASSRSVAPLAAAHVKRWASWCKRRCAGVSCRLCS